MPLNFTNPMPVDQAPLNIDQVVIQRYSVELDRQELLVDFRAYSNKIQVGGNRQATIPFDQAVAFLGVAAFMAYQAETKGYLYRLLQSSLGLKGTVV